MKRVDGLCTTLLRGTSRKMSSCPPQDHLVWRTCTDKPSWTSSQYLEVRCCCWTVVFPTVFANAFKLQASEEAYLFSWVQYIRNISGIYPLKCRDKVKLLSRGKELCHRSTVEWKRHTPCVFWPFPFSLWSVSKMVPSISVRPELLHLYFSVRTASELVISFVVAHCHFQGCDYLSHRSEKVPRAKKGNEEQVIHKDSFSGEN